MICGFFLPFSALLVVFVAFAEAHEALAPAAGFLPGPP